MAALLLIAAFWTISSPAQAGDSVLFEVGDQVDASHLSHLSLMHRSGMARMRVQVVADEGVPDISWIIRDWARPNRLKLLISLIRNRDAVNDPAYADSYAAIAAGVARQGANAIKVWNEPNLGREWPGINPFADMNLLAKAYAAIKQANRKTWVIGAGIAAYADTRECGPEVCGSPLFFRGMQMAAAKLRSESTPFVDWIGVYFNIGTTAPLALKGSSFSGKYTSYLHNVITNTSSFFRGELPLCFTELGYVSGEGVGGLPDNFGWARGITLRNQAEWLGQAATMLAASGKVRLMIVWNINLSSDDQADPQSAYAIVRPDGSCLACGTIKSVMQRR
ncbi:MAG: hypothetical protein HC853_00095 [Anaerolineae bacterium]|nr:hypothetical protein [Anaerolineae bacterium]